jgi:hypothetical protein
VPAIVFEEHPPVYAGQAEDAQRATSSAKSAG